MSHAIFTSFTNLIDSNGIPYPSAKVFVCEAGTTTLKTIYSDEDLLVTATNPVSVSQGGPHDMRYVAAGTYRIIVETGGGDTIGSGVTQSRYCKDDIDTGVAVGAGALGVPSGGTGSGTAAGARTNLGAASASEVANMSADLSTVQSRLGTTGATTVAVGTTAQEPAAGAGKVRFDSTTGRLRASNASAWANLIRSGELVPADFATGVVICRQKIYVPTTATTSITATTPATDSSIPLISEGTQILTQAVTPKSATSTFYLEARIGGTFPTGNDTIMAIFQSGSVNAIAADFARFSAIDGFLIIRGTFTPGSTTPLTFSVRVGVTGSTFALNHTASNNLGGVVPSYLLIEEFDTI